MKEGLRLRIIEGSEVAGLCLAAGPWTSEGEFVSKGDGTALKGFLMSV